MSKKTFDRFAEKMLHAGKIKFTTARHYGPDALIITNRVVDIPERDLLMPHDRVRCDKCGAVCALHPLTLKQAPEATIWCVHCAPARADPYTEIRSNPLAVMDMLRHRRSK